ncbi:glucan-binding protein, partial [Bacillus pseudomycoides]
YYLDEDGRMSLKLKTINEKTYYFGYEGVMSTGWISFGKSDADAVWRYFIEDGSMATDWRKIEGNWYYFDN